MQLRFLGRSGLQVSPLCFGGNVFGWTADEATSFALLDAWVDAGFNFIDTADVYSRWAPGHTGGESESVIGRWLKRSGKRHRIVLATKVGKDMGDGKVGLRPAYIRQAVEASLKRLQTDHIDLYQSHDDDTTVPLADTLGAYADLIRAGKVRAIGASNYSAARLQEALQTSERLGLPRYESLQPLFNLYDRAVFEDALQPLCAAAGRRDQLLRAGRRVPHRQIPHGSRRRQERTRRQHHGQVPQRPGLRILAALDAVAHRYNATPGQVAVAWQMVQPGITAPIASATSVAQLHELVKATQLQLDSDALSQLDAASAQG